MESWNSKESWKVILSPFYQSLICSIIISIVIGIFAYNIENPFYDIGKKYTQEILSSLPPILGGWLFCSWAISLYHLVRSNIKNKLFFIFFYVLFAIIIFIGFVSFFSLFYIAIFASEILP